jgi:tetratricopeptide (TPR) repeat protein
MKRTWVKVICITLALALIGAGVALAQEKKAAKPAKETEINKALLDSFELMQKQKYDAANKLLDKVLQKDPGNPLALNNKAAILAQKKEGLDKADTLLNQALPKSKGYMVQVNKVCKVGGLCSAFSPVTGSSGNQDLEPLIKNNIEILKGMMEAGPVPGSGTRPK